MIFSLKDMTVQAASDLLADLGACRQLRHVAAGDLEAVVDSVRNGRLSASVAWVFDQAFAVHGYACDVCGAVTAVSGERSRKAADRALDNLDGQVKLCLCLDCSRQCSQFCFREFGRGVRIPYCDDLEKMMLAYVAFETRTAARRFCRGEDPKRENTQARRGGPHHSGVAGRLDNPRSEPANGHLENDGHQMASSVRLGGGFVPMR